MKAESLPERVPGGPTPRTGVGRETPPRSSAGLRFPAEASPGQTQPGPADKKVQVTQFVVSSSQRKVNKGKEQSGVGTGCDRGLGVTGD